MNPHNYVENLKANAEITAEYYLKSFKKTEQQIFLESILQKDNRENLKVGDFAAGAGSLSYHLNARFNNAEFYLFDLNDSALELARQHLTAGNFNFFHHNIYEFDPKWTEYFDYVFCWQTLLLLDKPELALD